MHHVLSDGLSLQKIGSHIITTGCTSARFSGFGQGIWQMQVAGGEDGVEVDKEIKSEIKDSMKEGVQLECLITSALRRLCYVFG